MWTCSLGNQSLKVRDGGYESGVFSVSKSYEELPEVVTHVVVKTNIFPIRKWKHHKLSWMSTSSPTVGSSHQCVTSFSVLKMRFNQVEMTRAWTRSYVACSVRKGA